MDTTEANEGAEQENTPAEGDSTPNSPAEDSDNPGTNQNSHSKGRRRKGRQTTVVKSNTEELPNPESVRVSAVGLMDFVQRKVEENEGKASQAALDRVNGHLIDLKQSFDSGSTSEISSAISDLRSSLNEISSISTLLPVLLNAPDPKSASGTAAVEQPNEIVDPEAPPVITADASEEESTEIPSTVENDDAVLLVEEAGDPLVLETISEEENGEPELAEEEDLETESAGAATSEDTFPPMDSGADRLAENIFVGLGGTGVQVIEQFVRAESYSRKNKTPSLMPDHTYDYILVDTSRDLSPRAVGYSHTREGDGRWLENNRSAVLGDLRGGASKMPPLAEYVADQTLDRILREATGNFRNQFFQPGNHMVCMAHSVSGGSGCSLAKHLAKWINTDNALGLNLISFITLNELGKEGQDSGLLANAMYNFPQVTRAVGMSLLLDNQVVKQKIDNPRSTERIGRYIRHIENRILEGCPEYLEVTGKKEYILVDRYIHRIMSVMTRIPGDIGDTITGYFSKETSYTDGARWVVPHIYPVDRDYEEDYDQVPPALLTVRAITEGNLCKLSENGTQMGTKAVVIFEAPKDYRFRSKVPEQVSRVVAEMLNLDQKEGVQVTMVDSRGNGAAVYVLLLHPRTDFLDEWCDNVKDTNRMEALHLEWSNKVHAAANEEAVEDDGLVAGGLPNAWVRAYRGIIPGLQAGVTFDQENPDEPTQQLISKLVTDAKTKIDASAKYDIRGEFIEFALKVGLMSADPR